MPAKFLRRVDKESAYYHIYNKGVEGRSIFNDEEDFKVFLDYLKDYLSSVDPEHAKKVFSVRGRSFRGTPHQPKNYEGKVDLLAFSLLPNHFHLVLRQNTKGSLEGFIRSLCTRYSIYFNKKYTRTGTLFEGPYKSVEVENERDLSLLTRLLHKGSEYSSYPEYLGKRKTSWVKSIKKESNYRDFVENYEPSQEEVESLAKISLDQSTTHLERRDPARNLRPRPRVTEFVAAIAVFLLLVGLGVRNIQVSRASTPEKVAEASPPPQVSGAEDIKPENKITVAIRINDGAETVPVLMEPTDEATKIAEVKDGEIYEFVSINSGWFEIKLTNGSTGFVSFEYVEILE